MGEGVAADLQPHRQWPLWLALGAAAIWLIVAVAAVFRGSMAASAALPAALLAAMPPLVAGLAMASLLRAIRPAPDITALEQRLLDAGDAAAGLATLLADIDVKLAGCADRTRTLTGTTAATGDGLAATALRLTAAAGEVSASGAAAEGAAARLAATLPDLARVEALITDMGGRLGGDTVNQLEIIDALLASVQVRGDEVSTQADVAITSINKQLADIDEASRQTTSRIAKRAYALDAAVDGASTRATALLDSVAVTIADRMAVMDDRLSTTRTTLDAVGADSGTVIAARLDQLHAAAAKLEQQFTAAEAQHTAFAATVASHLDELPRRLAAARDDGVTALDAIVARADAVHVALGDLALPLSASDSSLGGLATQVAALQTAAERVDATLGQALPAASAHLSDLDQGAGQVELRIAAIDASFVAAQQASDSLADAVAQLRGEVTALGEADLRLVDDRLVATGAVMHDIGRQITAYGALSSQTKAIVEAELADLARQLREVQGDSNARLTAVGDQVGMIHAAAETLAMPLAAARRLADDVDAQTRRSADTAASFGAELAAQIDAAAASFGEFHNRSTVLLGEADALGAATRSGGKAIDASATRFAAQRDAFAAAAAALETAFDRARDDLTALDNRTGKVTAGAAQALGDAFGRARELGEAHAAAFKVMLAGIVADAGDALGQTGAAVAANAFADPIRSHLAAINASAADTVGIAQTAAQRVAGQATALKATVAEVNAKVDEIETRLEIRARDTLSARSTRLVEMLQSASVDIARLLSADIGQQAWTRYAKGDRSLFARRLVQPVDRGTTDKIARHFAHDPAFNDEASHYLDLFERLSRRIASDPDGDALLATIVSSDIGKLYVVIARATGRWSPMA